VLLQNEGYLPTYVSEQAKTAGVNKPVKVSIDLGDGGEIVTGPREREVGHLQGRVNQYDVLSWNGTFGIESRARAEWVVRASSGGSVTVTAHTEKAGKVSTEIKLG
jgi:hypothetical protein